MKTGQQGIDLIKHFESLHDGDLTKIGLQPKLCPAGVVTWGYGHTETYNGAQIKDFETANKQFPEIETLTVEDAEKLLMQDLVKEEIKIHTRINVPITQYQFDALVSYFFNIGYSATMVQLVNLNATAKEITDWMTKHYTTVGGVYMPGLFYRRQSEALLFTTGELRFFNQ
jgi:lysozyme